MDSVSFHEEEFVRRSAVSSAGGITGAVIRFGLASDVKGANRLMLAFAAVFLLMALAAPFLIGSEPSQLPPQEVIDAAMRRQSL